MRLIPYDVTTLNATGYRMSDNHAILIEFAESGMKCAKVEGSSCKNAYIAQTSLTKSIERYRMTGIRCFTRKGEIYLINERLD